MSSDSCVFLMVLPELTMLVLINVILVFALLFSGSEQSSLIENTDVAVEDNVLPKLNAGAYTAPIITPVLQTEPVAKLTILCLVCSSLVYLNSHQQYVSGFGLIMDDLGRFMSVFLTLSASCALALSLQALKRFSRYEFILLLWLSLLGMLCLIKSYSFLALYLSIELQSLSFYMLAAMRSRTEASSEAGLKYFILSAFSSAMLLLGMALIYSACGSQNFADLAHTLNHFLTVPQSYPMTSLWVGLGCIAVSLLFKLGAAPFHAWIADVYEGSHTSITAWFAITAKIAVATALIRLNSPHMLLSLLTFVASSSLIVGSLSAMRQVKLKRLIAFSAVANAGWFVLALVSGQWQLMVIHLMVYTILSINLFSVFILPLFRSHPSLAYRTRTDSTGVSADSVDHAADSNTVKYISDLHQIYKVNPSIAFAVTISMFSLAGMPPLAGFYSKYLILSAVTQTEMYLVLSLALAVAILSAYYYLRVIKTIYFSSSSNDANAAYGGQWWFTMQELPFNAYITSMTTAATCVFFLKPDYFCVWLNLV